MKDVARRAYLLDCYGPLLTDKQRDIYEWYFQQDLSLGEISAVAHVSRNAVHDLVNRTDAKLERYERALGLVEAEKAQREAIHTLHEDFRAWVDKYSGALDDNARKEMQALMAQVAGMQRD